MVIGDTHGNTGWTIGRIHVAGAKKIDKIVQVGDFGTGFKGWTKFTDALNEAAAEQNVDFYFIDGNHDSTEAIYAKSLGTTEDGFEQLGSNLFYIPRAHAWEWDGLKMLGVGGAVSIDKPYRLAVEQGYDCPEWGYYHYKGTPGKGEKTLWWPTEQITQEDITKARAQGPVDVLFTHDCPEEFIDATGMNLKPDLDSKLNRGRVMQIARAVKPKYWFHGHMHTFAKYSFMHNEGYTTVYGLANDGKERAWLVLDTEQLSRV